MLTFSTYKGELLTVDDIYALIHARITDDIIQNLKFDINFVERVTIKLDPDLINSICCMAQCEGDRELSNLLVARLRDHLVNGRFYWPQWDVAYCIETNEIIRMNGQHSGNMLQNVVDDGLFDAFLSSLYVSLGIHIVKTKKSLILLFDSFDNLRSARTIANSINVRLAAEDLLKELGIKLKPGSVEKIVAGIATFMKLTDRKFAVKDTKDRPEYVSSFISFIAHYWQYTRHQKPRHFDLVGVVAGMFATYNYCPMKAAEFWAAVFQDIGDPTAIHRQVSNYLGSSTLQTKHHKKLTPTETQLQQIAVAFDAFVGNKPIKNLAQVTRIPAWLFEMDLRVDTPLVV